MVVLYDLNRYRKCLSCHNQLMRIGSSLEQKKNRHEGRLQMKIFEMLELCKQVTQSRYNPR